MKGEIVIVTSLGLNEDDGQYDFLVAVSVAELLIKTLELHEILSINL